MNKERANELFFKFKKYIPADKYRVVRDKLMEVDDDDTDKLMFIDFVDPTKNMVYSTLLGMFAVDRFYQNDIKYGVIKILLNLVTFGIFGIVDVFFSDSKMREMNYELLMQAIHKKTEKTETKETANSEI